MSELPLIEKSDLSNLPGGRHIQALDDAKPSDEQDDLEKLQGHMNSAAFAAENLLDIHQVGLEGDAYYAYIRPELQEARDMMIQALISPVDVGADFGVFNPRPDPIRFDEEPRTIEGNQRILFDKRLEPAVVRDLPIMNAVQILENIKGMREILRSKKDSMNMQKAARLALLAADNELLVNTLYVNESPKVMSAIQQGKNRVKAGQKTKRIIQEEVNSLLTQPTTQERMRYIWDTEKKRGEIKLDVLRREVERRTGLGKGAVKAHLTTEVLKKWGHIP